MPEEQRNEQETYVIIGQCQHCDQNFVKHAVGDLHEDCPGKPPESK